MTDAPVPAACPGCGEVVAEGDEFCESCGARLHAPDPGEGACPKCWAPADQADPDGYCGRCGARLPRPGDHAELVVGGAPGDLLSVAAVTDKGLRHHRNEDAMALRCGPAFSVIVVCDGVSTTANPDQASAAAAVAFADMLVEALASDPAPEGIAQAMQAAARRAKEAVEGVPLQEPGGYVQAPSSTLVAAVVTAVGLVTANVGDSRAYWIDPSPAAASRQLTTDDSLAEAAIAEGVPPEDAYAARDAHTITRWLGADGPDPVPHVGITPALGPGILLVCSDGLWNYFESPDTLRDLLARGPAGEGLLDAARRLVDAAIEAGGMDNITVALAAPAWPAPAEPAAAEPAAVEPGPAEAETVTTHESEE